LLESRFGTTAVRLAGDGVRIGPQRGAGEAYARNDANAERDQRRPPWQASLATLERMLQADSGKRRARRIRLVLANEFVRYTLVPWKAERLTETEREQVARALLQQRYGERESRWQLSIEPQRFEKPALAAAVDADLMEAAQNLAVRLGFRLVSTIPALVVELNRHRRRLGRVAGGWLVDASDGRLASLAFVGNAWAQVSNERYAGFSAALKEMLLPLLRRDAMRMPKLLGGTVFLANGSAGEIPALIDEAWPVVRLAAA
jgi:hypothetical protein